MTAVESYRADLAAVDAAAIERELARLWREAAEGPGDATPEGDVRMIDYTGGSEAAARQAFEAARRAIIRCEGSDGYGLPPEKYDAWRDIEITFNPEGMRLR